MYNDEFKEYHYSRGETARDEYSPVAALHSLWEFAQTYVR